MTLSPSNTLILFPTAAILAMIRLFRHASSRPSCSRRKGWIEVWMIYGHQWLPSSLIYKEECNRKKMKQKCLVETSWNKYSSYINCLNSSGNLPTIGNRTDIINHFQNQGAASNLSFWLPHTGRVSFFLPVIMWSCFFPVMNGSLQHVVLTTNSCYWQGYQGFANDSHGIQMMQIKIPRSKTEANGGMRSITRYEQPSASVHSAMRNSV